MNKHIIIGNLTQDPTGGTTRNGDNYCRFTVAVNGYNKDAPAEFIRVTAWRALGDSCLKYLKKGRKVCVVGRSRASAWQSQEGKLYGQINLDAEDVEFLTPKSAEDAESPAEEPPTDPESGMAQVDPEEQPW